MVKDTLTLIGFGAVLIFSAAWALGWIELEIGLGGGILIFGFLLVAASVQIALGLLAAVADLLACRCRRD